MQRVATGKLVLGVRMLGLDAVWTLLGFGGERSAYREPRGVQQARRLGGPHGQNGELFQLCVEKVRATCFSSGVRQVAPKSSTNAFALARAFCTYGVYTACMSVFMLLPFQDLGAPPAPQCHFC